ncbi:MAG: hypothetical protein PVG09_06020 [Thiohalocapsa sp.]|jgi:hypothetical protein
MVDAASRAQCKNDDAEFLDGRQDAETYNGGAEQLIQRGETVIAKLHNGNRPSSPELLFALEQELRELADNIQRERERRLQLSER